MKTSKDIADEVWRMLPDDCKQIMRPIKKSFKESVIADIDEAVKNNAVSPLVSGSASERYRKALGYISEMTFEIEIGAEKGSDVLEKALRIASGYNID